MHSREKKSKKQLLHPMVAGWRLIEFAMSTIMLKPAGVRVHWQLTLTFQYSKEAIARHPGPAIGMGGKVSSGYYDNESRDEELALFGVAPELEAKSAL